MTDNDIVEFRDFKFNHYMHHFDEYEEELQRSLDEQDSLYHQDDDYEDLFWEN